MTDYRKVACILAVLGVLLSGFPRFNPVDVSRDDVVDLRDAVILAKQFADSAVIPHTFKHAAGQAITALRVAAGMKTVLSSDNDTTIHNNATFTVIGLLSSTPIPTHLISAGQIRLADFTNYHSISISPPSPPPEAVS